MPIPAKNPPEQPKTVAPSATLQSDHSGRPESSEGCVVVFVEPGGVERTVNVLVGQNLMDAALTAGVAGITGQCGGAINCATCLCDFAPEAIETLPPQHPDEAELLSYVDEASTNSRLACQLPGSPGMNGMVARVVVSIASPDD